MKKKLLIFSSVCLIITIIGLCFWFTTNDVKISAAESQIPLADKTITASMFDASKGNLVDENLSTLWGGNSDGADFYWQVDMGSSYDISKIRSYKAQSISGFIIYSSENGVDWTDRTGTYGPDFGWTEFTTFNPGGITHFSARYLRAYRPAGGGPGTGGDFYELEAYESGSSPTPTPSGSGTPTPSPSDTPTPSGSITPSPSISGSDGPGPIVCAHPPCFDNPDDPIYPPSPTFNIELLAPNGGEVWKIGKEYTIKWRYTDDEQKIKKFALFLSKNGGKNFRQVIEQNIDKSKKEYEWSIPDDEAYVTDEAKVLVAAYGDSIDRPLLSDPSDDNFKIIGKEKFLSTDKFNLPFWLALILLFLSGSAVLWPLTLNFLLNSFMTDLLNRLPLLTAPTMGNKKGTGIVYDSATQSPIIKAVVRIFNVENNKQLESIITNQKGEFSFLVPNGSYYLTVNSTDHDFPSKKFKRPEEEKIFTPGVSDGVYTNLYFGQKILVKKERGGSQRYALNINIPLDKTGTYNVQEKVLKFLRVIGNVLVKIKWPSIGLGTLLAVFLVWADFSILHLVILELYLILILYEVYRLLVKTRPYGLVMDNNEKAVDLTVVRFNQNKKIIATSISGHDGKFTAQVNPGRYNLLAKKSGFFETEQKNISIKSARKLEKIDLILKKA